MNLEKAKSSLVLSLQKAGVVEIPKLEVLLGMDVSGSFDDEHRDGSTDTLLTRLVPWGLTFDPDNKLDAFTFSNGAASVMNVGSVDASNHYRFVQSKIIGVKGYGGGTAYSHLIERALQHFGWIGETVKKAGFIGGLFGKKDQVVKAERKRSLVIIITDGDNNEPGDKDRTNRILAESQQRKDQVYFLFLGVSNQGSSFPFLEKLGDAYDNTGFVGISNLKTFIAQTDEQLNKALLGDELLTWLKN